MPLDARRRFLAALVLVLAGVGYVLAPLAAASPARPGMVLGHVPVASSPLTGAVVVGPGGAVTGYYTKVVVVTQGSALTFVNLDEIAHTVTSVARDTSGAPLFNGNALPGTTSDIQGVDRLAPGTYAFYCQFHPNMQGTLIVEGQGHSGVKAAKPSFHQPLRLPPTLTGSHLRIPIEQADVRTLPHGPKTLMWTYGGSYPGPTIRRPAGRRTTITFVDKLPRTAGDLTVHLHGDHHASTSDGLPDSSLIRPGGSRTYVYPLTDGGKAERAAFDFYHDHRMDETGRNVWNGLQGMFITSDKVERKLNLPTGKYDVPLDVADRSFDGANQLTNPFPHPGDGTTSTSKFVGPYAAPGDASVGDHVLVNGVSSPYFDVATHRYRLRLLNGSNFQSYDFHLSNGQPFVQIGTGSGLLPKAVVRTDILLGPAQRADVIVDFGHDYGKKIVLASEPRTDSQPGGIGTPDVPVMQFRVTKRTADRTRIPSRLEPLPPLAAPATPSMVWTFGLGGDANRGTFWSVNGHPYDPTRVDTTVPLGSTQTWLLQNLSPITHYIHIHEEQWRTISRDGGPPPAYEAGLQDTWRLDPGESVEVAAKFTDYAGVFMIHCHMLDHEDHGMMAQFAVVKSSASALPPGYHFGPSRSAVVGMGGMSAPTQSAMAQSAMAQMASMTGLAADAPMWVRLMTRAGWAVSIEAPLLALAMLWRRRRVLPDAAARAVTILLLAGVATTHASDWLDKLVEAPYLAVGFGLLIVGAAAASIALACLRRPDAVRRVRRAVGVASAMTIAGYIVSRSIGLPQLEDHVGHWADSWGTASLVVESMLVLALIRSSMHIARRPRPTWRGVHMSKPRWVVALATAVTVTTAVAGSVPSQAAPKSRVLLVCNGSAGCPAVKGVSYYRSLQLAVDHASNGDWILVWPGKYSESVQVQQGHGLTSGLHIRGMNRNGVVFDGKKAGGSAVHVLGVNNTWVENMTGQNYLTGAANAFYWTGVDGYWGNYLTAYNNGDYGIYAYDSTSSGKLPATLAHDYASWNADSGIYIGGCRDCNAVVVDSHAEKNAIGYSGTNAGGELYLLNSEWDHNASGILPNTLTSEPDPPQSGAFIVNNYVHDNNDTDVPGTGIAGIVPAGV
ncbi:MAG: multicopper oxidase domain-containing protein, partial [Frankiales bacterium]|nr:multicopper oxidase domain-containing protein [Frankiales bacterium]